MNKYCGRFASLLLPITPLRFFEYDHLEDGDMARPKKTRQPTNLRRMRPTTLYWYLMLVAPFLPEVINRISNTIRTPEISIPGSEIYGSWALLNGP